MIKRKEKLDELETEWLSEQYQKLDDETRRIRKELEAEGREEERRFQLEIAGLSPFEQYKRKIERNNQRLLWETFYITRYLAYISKYEVVTPDIEFEAMKHALFDPLFSNVNLVLSIVDKIEDQNKAKWVKEKLDRLEAFQSMDMGTMHIQSMIVDKIEGAHEAAMSHGVDLDEFPSSYSSKEVQKLEEEYGPLKDKITPFEAKILDFIWHNVEAGDHGVWSRKVRDFVYRDEEERVEYFTQYAEALEKEYDGGEKATEFVSRYVNEKMKRKSLTRAHGTSQMNK